LTSGFAVTFKKVEWTIYVRQTYGGALVPVTNGSGATVSAPLPKPSPPPMEYYIGCECDFEVTGKPLTTAVIEHTFSDAAGKALVDWTRTPLQANFELVSALVTDQAGNVNDVFWIKFINTQ
jgi:hypothetical protein